MRIGRRQLCVLAAIAVLLLDFPQHVDAAEIKLMPADEIERALFKKTRAIRPVRKGPADLQAVTFEFNSADLTPLARRQLDELARVLTKPRYEQVEFVVSGHTDAVGEPVYNNALSERRARAVVQYLVSRHSMDQRRIISEGRGESQMMPNLDPSDPAQRRARIEVVGGNR